MSGLVQIESGASNFTLHDRPTWELYSTCIHCGLCLNHCPTYRVLGMEMDSPRGRIYQVLQADAGHLPIGETFVTHIDRCLGCVACETACPSGVPYGRIVERARAQIEQQYPRPLLSRWLRAFFFGRVLRDYHLLTRLARLLGFYQRSGLQWLARHSGVLHLLGVAQVESLAPQIDQDFFLDEIGMIYPPDGERRASVAFHAGCIASVAFSGLNRATVRVLNRNGVEVYVFPQQRCCGALHAHAGRREEARLLARRNLDALERTGRAFDAIVTNSAGCGSHMKEYFDLLAGDPAYGARAQAYAGQTRDITEFLAGLGLRPPRLAPHWRRVTYQDPCHLAHAQRIRSAPRELLRATGHEIVELAHPDQCCGSAGTYNVTQNELSMRILAARMEEVSAVAPAIDAVVTANTGCALQLSAGLRDAGIKLPVRHVIEMLDQCY